MKKNLKHYVEELRLMSLEVSEKDRIRAELLLFTYDNPHTLENEKSEPLSRSRSQSTVRAIQGLFTRPLALISVISLFLIITGGTSFAAEKATPGAPLYNIKIHVNEPLRAALAMTSEAKAEWNVDRVERRLQEAEQLSAANTLDERAANTLNQLLNTQAQEVALTAASLSTQDNNAESAKILSSLESTLKAHSEVLLQMGTSTNQNVKKNVSKILDNTIDIAQETEDLHSHAENNLMAQNAVGLDVQAKNTVQAAHDARTKAQTLLDSSRSFISAETLTRIELSIKASSDALANADNAMKAKLFIQAFASAQQAHRLAVEAQTIINSIKRFDSNQTQAHQQDSTENSNPDTGATTVQFRLDEERGGRLQQLRNGNGKLRDSVDGPDTNQKIQSNDSSSHEKD